MILKRVLFIIIFLFLFILSFVLYTNKAFLYSPYPTHYNLTQQMINLYNLAYDPDLTSKQIELVLKGSMDEDTLPRPAFHLYDPVYNRAPYGVYTAKKWALNSDVQTPFYLRLAVVKKIFTGTFLYHGDYSWQANVNSYIKNDLDKAYYGLGHILHLIEDMTVPAHSRNDHHIMGDPYEQWAKESLKSEDYNWAEKLYNQGYYPKYLYIIGEAFDELARYGNKYFFSKDTILSKDYTNPKIVQEKSEDYGYISQRTYAWGEDENGRLFRLARTVVLDPWEVVLFNREKSRDDYFIKNDDHKLNTDYWQHLAPKAVIYGAGAIRLFIKDAEYQKKLAQQKQQELSLFQKAQIFVKDILGIEDENQTTSQDYFPSLPLPQPSPSRFPVSEPLVDFSKPVDKPIESPVKEEPGDGGQQQGVGGNEQVPVESDENQPVANPPDMQAGKGDGSIVVKGEKTGPTGGISWRETTQTSNTEEEQEEEEPEPESHLIINEIQIKDNEFVELYNPTDSAISLASHSFCYYSSSRDWNNPYRNKIFPATASISAEGYYLIGLEGYSASSGNPDSDWQVYDSRQLSNSAGSIAIFPWDPTTKTADEAKAGAIDAAAWGSVDYVKEGTPFSTLLGQDKSMQRKNYQDTDDNNADFEYKKIPTPTNSNGETRTPGTFIPDNTIISENTTWTIAGSPYYINSNASQWSVVNSGVVLTIEPGVVIMPQNANYTFLEIRGTLKAEGTASEKIVFTSKYDTEYGGVGSASAGDWKNIVFTSTSTDSVLDYTLFRYGGKSNSQMIKVDSSLIELKNSTLENSQTDGIYLKNSNSKIEDSIIRDNRIGIVIEGGSPEIKNNQIKDNSQYGIKITDSASPEIKNNSFSNNSIAAIYLKSSYPEFSNNSASNNGLNGILVDSQTRIEQDETWEADLVYILESNSNQFITVASGSTLTLELGVIIKPKSQYYTALLIEGTLRAEAASGSEIVFTSLKDDNFGGDTNNDGSVTAPASGNWKNIRFKPTSAGSVLDHVFIYYSSTPAIVIDSGASVEEGDVDYDP